jgi:hypothetical protein
VKISMAEVVVSGETKCFCGHYATEKRKQGWHPAIYLVLSASSSSHGCLWLISVCPKALVV